MCKKVQTKQTFISQLFVALSAGVVSFILFLESLPIYKYLFGESTSESTPESPLEDPTSEKKYRIQFFSNIVKAVLPTTMDETMKDGFVYMYWTFFSTLLTSFFTMKMQSC
jgi:hypothetical protein